MAPIAMAGVMLAGTAMQVVGGIQQANAAAEAAEYNAQGAEANARATRLQAAREEGKERFNTRLALGSIRAQYGASGVKMEGSAVDYLEHSAAIGEQNALDIRFRGEQQALAYQRQADIYRKGGDAAQAGAVLGSIGTGLSGFTNFMKRV